MEKQPVNQMRLHSIGSLFVISLGALLVQCGLFDATNKRLIKTIAVDASVNVAAFSPTGEFVATVGKTDLWSGKYPIKLWQTSDGRLRFVTSEYSVYGLTFSSDGSMLAASCRDGVRLFRISDGQLLRTLPGNQLFALAFAPDSQSLAAGGAEGEVRIWRVADGEVLRTLDSSRHITSLAFSRDGKVLAGGTSSTIGFVRPEEASTDSNPIVLWRLSDGQELLSLPGHKFGVLSLAFYGDGQTLASGGSDGFLRVWRLPGGDLVKAIPIGINANGSNSRSEINDLDFSPDGKSLASAVANDIVFFRSADFSHEFTLKSHSKTVLQLQYAQVGTLFSIAEDKNVRVWR